MPCSPPGSRLRKNCKHYAPLLDYAKKWPTQSAHLKRQKMAFGVQTSLSLYVLSSQRSKKGETWRILRGHWEGRKRVGPLPSTLSILPSVMLSFFTYGLSIPLHNLWAKIMVPFPTPCFKANLITFTAMCRSSCPVEFNLNFVRMCNEKKK